MEEEEEEEERWKQRRAIGSTYVHPLLEEPVAMLSFVMTASCGFTRNEVVLPSFKYVLWVVECIWFCLVWLFMSQSTAMVMSG